MDAAPLILALAAGASNSDRTMTVIQLGGIAVALIVVGIVVIALVRKKLLGDDDTFGIEGNFTLSDLRRLLDDGRISQEEYDRAKQLILARSREMLHDDEADSDKGDATR